MLDTVREATHALARELKVIGLMNVQFADQGQPALRARSQPARLAHRALRGQGHRRAAGETRRESHDRLKLKDLGFTREQTPKHWCVKEAVFPFVRFPGRHHHARTRDAFHGRGHGLDDDLGVAFAKAQAAAKPGLPTGGNVFLSVKDADKPRVVDLARQLEALGFAIYSTSGTAKHLADNGVKVSKLAKIEEGRPTAVDLIKNGQIQLVINTPPA
jgi:carbamoyl-phosphate synthase large subunit